MKNLIAFFALMSISWTSHAESNLSSFSNQQLLQSTGQHLMGMIATCSVSTLGIATSAVFETLPFTSNFVSQAAHVELSSSNYHMDKDKTEITTSYGAIGGLVTDVTKMAYKLLFTGNLAEQKEIFEQSQTSYAATEAFRKHFFSENGDCGKAASKLSATLSEISSRRK